ncbi:hypothetical protein BKA67DRAFT_577443 [Truncatella angustata]|uniref:Secreted protein n=1 Tax=Truncatella angustata TaxID=152316 RepID=A0A9P8RNG6_9PEZI|nr:uncharacterized protein BKA67DRAFT_577443 [Truncatella angustata]KAH6647430.1 hypothetical protein BKA67DRAFT_577443 [Truncatella angustata]
MKPRVRCSCKVNIYQLLLSVSTTCALEYLAQTRGSLSAVGPYVESSRSTYCNPCCKGQDQPHVGQLQSGRRGTAQCA